MSIDRNFPSTRLRRLRKSANLRAMLAETQLTVSDLIQPIFIKENLSGREAIETMPGIDRLGLDIVNEEIQILQNLKIFSDKILFSGNVSNSFLTASSKVNFSVPALSPKL